MAPPSKKAQRQLPLLRVLPEDVIEDIFARLPAKSVLRCRCLSRAWATLLSSRAFINRHHDLANRRSLGAVFFPAARHRSQGHPHIALLTRRRCRGLVLLRGSSSSLAGAYYVGNPSTGQMTALPGGRRTMEAAGTAWFPGIGLGYDARAECHKVVRVFHRPAGCEVYDIGAGSTGYWRPAASGAVPPCWVNALRTAGVFARGHVHWLATRRRPRERRFESDSVMSFSVGDDETFRSIPLPPRACRPPNRTDLDGGDRLCLIMSERTGSLHIWTLEDYDAGAWNPLCHIGETMLSQLGFPPPLATVDDGRRVIYFRSPSHDHAYDPATGALESTLLEPREEESLESTGRPHEDITFSSPFAQALSMALRRLPARTLGRIEGVCRSWRAIIQSGRFVASHNEHHRRAASRSSVWADRVIFTSVPPAGRKSVPLDACLSSPGLVAMPPLMNRSRALFISKPCHGLALASRRGWSELFNPVTGLHRRFLVRRCFDAADDDRGCVGLGYDQSREEHVLVLLALTSDRRAMECKVWRLRDDLEARTAPAPPIPVSLDVPPVYLDERMYWMGRTSSVPAILSFDILAGAFDVVPAPPGDHDSDSTELLAELRGALCVVRSCRSAESMTIWSAAKDGGWTREHVIQLRQWPEFSPKTVELVIPMGVEPEDGRILLDTGRALGYYDPVNRTMETVYSLHSKLQSDDRSLFAAVLWDESLVRPYT